MPHEARGVVGAGLAVQRSPEDRVRFLVREPLGVGGERRVVGGRGAELLERGAALFQRLDKGSIVDHLDSGRLGQPLDMLAPAWRFQIDHGVGTEGGMDAPTPWLGAQGRMAAPAGRSPDRWWQDARSRSARTARADCRPARRAARRSGRRCAAPISPFSLLADTENADQLVGQPEPGRRAGKEVEVFGEALPDAPVILFHAACRPAWERRDPPAEYPGCRACGRHNDRG